jgi:integrase
VSVSDRWHLSRPPAGARRCPQHRKAPSAGHGAGLRWQVRGTDGDGRPVKRNFGYEEHAKAFDAELKAAVRAGTYVDDRAGDITLAAYAEQWRASRVHDPATAERIRSAFANHVYESGEKGGRDRTAKGGMAIGGYPMRVLARRVSVLQEWIRSLPLHPNTARLVITDLSQVFTAAVDDSVIARNPLRARSVQRPAAVHREAAAWTADQVGAAAAGLPAALAALPYLGTSCGQRQGELCAVAAGDLDFLRRSCHVGFQVKYHRGRLHFAPTKNGKVRDVPVAAPVIPLLSEHVRLHPPVTVTLPWMRADGKVDGTLTRRLVFAHPSGQPWYKGTLQRPWDRARAAAGIPAAAQVNGMHVLRHTAASAWLSAGLNLAKVAAYLGDTKEVVLKTYAHFMPDDDDRARAIMDGFFSGPAGRPDALIVPPAADGGELWPVSAAPLIFRTKFSGVQARHPRRPHGPLACRSGILLVLITSHCVGSSSALRVPCDAK